MSGKKMWKKIGKILLCMCLAAVIFIGGAVLSWIYIPQIQARRPIAGIEQLAKDVNHIPVAQEVSVYAIGEASHGNAEFQELRLTLLKQLVEKDGVRAFALEADMSEGILLNEFIHGRGVYDTAEDAVMQLSFQIYHTKQMVELVEWMKLYNEKVEEEERLSFYGYDIQNPEVGLRMLADHCRERGVSCKELQKYLAGETALGSQIAESLDALQENLQLEDDAYLARIIWNARNYIACFPEGEMLNYIDYSNKRDACMADNIVWILENMGGGKLLISGHNGHVGVGKQYYTPMGAHLREKFGDKYFVIGTDYYKTTCNINSGTQRGDYTFCSANPLAYQAKKLGGMYYLDIHRAAELTEIETLFNNQIHTGSLGESYSVLMKFIPTSHRVQLDPRNYYDAMIFVYSATPIRILDESGYMDK